MNASFEINLHKQALEDIKRAIQYYNEQENDLGVRFGKEIAVAFLRLSMQPFFQIRYKNIRCYPLKKFPFMIHYSVNENKVDVYGVIHTSLDPDTYWLKK